MWDGNRYGTIGNIKGVGQPTIRIHPTEKPIFLYKWLLKNYAKHGDSIFDSHMGSQSSRIACYDGGFDFVGCELDKEYFDAGNKRFENFKAQLKLF
jgi:site-specific DNA-methyltransferase (adenine-specific)